MKNIMYLIATIMLIFLAIGVFIFSVSGIIHILLVIALIAVILKIIQGKPIFVKK